MKKPQAVFCWSGGKDSTLALYKTLLAGQVEVVALLTTLNQQHKRISMHGVREALLELQAASIGIPLYKAWVTGGSNEEYERVMEAQFLSFKDAGVSQVIFGDIFLEDLRSYREKNLAALQLEAVFPLWKQNTTGIINEFLLSGFKTVTCCVSAQFFDESFVGEELNQDFISRLPDGVDACGENGEFHSFCYAGPVFKKAIQFSKGEKIFRRTPGLNGAGNTGFWYIDLVPLEK